MNKANAHDKLTQLVSSYKSRFDLIGVNSEFEVYFLDSGSFKEVSADECADSVCATITLATSQGNEAVCGFDIVADIDRRGKIDDAKLDKSIAEFSMAVDEFLKKIAISENRDAIIREAANQEKTLLQSSIDNYNSDIKKLQTRTIILTAVVIALIFIAVFAFIGR